MTEKESIQYQVDWRIKFIAALEEKLSLINKMMTGPGGLRSVVIDIELANYKIEGLELEHRITYAKIALNDWTVRLKDYNERFSADVKEARENIDKIIGIANGAIAMKPNPRLEELMKKFNTVNKHNDEQLNIFYKSLRVELQTQKLI